MLRDSSMTSNRKTRTGPGLRPYSWLWIMVGYS